MQPSLNAGTVNPWFPSFLCFIRIAFSGIALIRTRIRLFCALTCSRCAMKAENHGWNSSIMQSDWSALSKMANSDLADRDFLVQSTLLSQI